MGIGTLLSGGVVKCDNCGKMIKGQSDTMGGLGLLVDIGRSIGHHFCSDRCKREWNEAHGKDDDSSDGGGGYDGDGGRAAEIEAEAKAAEAAETKAEIRDITEITFGTSSDDISETLNQLFSKLSATEKGIMSSDKEKRGAILEKVEFGILKLQKSDPDMAAFFQKKFENERPKSAKETLTNVTGTLKELFGKK